MDTLKGALAFVFMCLIIGLVLSLFRKVSGKVEILFEHFLRKITQRNENK